MSKNFINFFQKNQTLNEITQCLIKIPKELTQSPRIKGIAVNLRI